MRKKVRGLMSHLLGFSGRNAIIGLSAGLACSWAFAGIDGRRLQSPCVSSVQANSPKGNALDTFGEWACFYVLSEEMACNSGNSSNTEKASWEARLNAIGISLLDLDVEETEDIKQVTARMSGTPQLSLSIYEYPDQSKTVSLRRAVSDSRFDPYIFDIHLSVNCAITGGFIGLPLSNQTLESKASIGARGRIERTEILHPPVLPLNEIYPKNSFGVTPGWDQIEKIVSRKDRIRVAILDTGADYNLISLAYKIARPDVGFDFQEDSVEPYDSRNHGTTVALIAAGGTDDVELIVLKHPESDHLRPLYGKAAEMAISRGARVVNMSFGLHRGLDELKEVIKRHPEVLFVAAAGNGGIDLDTNPVFPASWKYPNVITVTAVSSKDELSSFANFGRKTVDLAAPGEDISISFSEVGQRHVSGTSFAAPWVTNAAVRMLAVAPSLSPREVVSILNSTALPATSLAGKTVSGGVLNLGGALRMVREGRKIESSMNHL